MILLRWDRYVKVYVGSREIWSDDVKQAETRHACGCQARGTEVRHPGPLGRRIPPRAIHRRATLQGLALIVLPHHAQQTSTSSLYSASSPTHYSYTLPTPILSANSRPRTIALLLPERQRKLPFLRRRFARHPLSVYCIPAHYKSSLTSLLSCRFLLDLPQHRT